MTEHDDWGPDFDDNGDPTWFNLLMCVVVAIVIIGLCYLVFYPEITLSLP